MPKHEISEVDLIRISRQQLELARESDFCLETQEVQEGFNQYLKDNSIKTTEKMKMELKLLRMNYQLK